MNCPRCRHKDEDGGRNFCGACGASLVQFCRFCGGRNRLADKFCGGCGAGLGEAPSRSEAAGASAPAHAEGEDDSLAELIESAVDNEEAVEEDPISKVSQVDIDSLFGE